MRSSLPATFSASSALLLISLSAPAFAGEIDVASAIDSVTVYPDAAIVTRVATVDLPQGDSAIVFKDLPLSLDPASLRVSGQGAAKIIIGSVDAAVAPSTAKASNDAIAEKLASLREERARLGSMLDALKAKRAMIIRYSQAEPTRASGDAKPLDVSQWSVAWDAVGTALAKLGDELLPAEAKARALDEEIQGLEAEQRRPPADAARRAASVALNAENATSAQITLSYRVVNVGWRPAYDASLDTNAAAKTVTLARRALLSQRTGEDWSNVALTVSTARVAGMVGAPDLQPIKIDFWQPPIVFAAPTGAAERSEAPASKAASAQLGPKSAESAPTPPASAVAESTAENRLAAYNAEFKVAGRVSLAGDGAQKSFLLARSDAPATLLFKTAPSLDPTVYLAAHITDDAQAPLLPGDIALHRDGAFVGQAPMAFVPPGDAVDLGFGADDKIKVTRVAVSRKENEPTWYNQTKIETREFKTTVKNWHDFPVKVQVNDQLPYSENTAIAVEQLSATTPPTEKQVADKRGVMSWTLDLQPGESKEVRLAYRLKWPADRDVTIAGTPIAELTR
jgi:uncharacterized protein (TIGR02231 family)